MTPETRVRKYEHVTIEGVDIERWYLRNGLVLGRIVDTVLDPIPNVFVEDTDGSIYGSDAGGRPDDPELNPFH